MASAVLAKREVKIMNINQAWNVFNSAELPKSEQSVFVMDADGYVELMVRKEAEAKGCVDGIDILTGEQVISSGLEMRARYL